MHGNVNITAMGELGANAGEGLATVLSSVVSGTVARPAPFEKAKGPLS